MYFCHIFLTIHSLKDTGCFHILTIIKNAVMNTGVHIHLGFNVFISLPRSRIAGLYRSSDLDAFYLFFLANFPGYKFQLYGTGVMRVDTLVLFLRKKLFNFSSLNMLVVGLSYLVFIMLRYDPIANLRVFIIKGCWILSNSFSASIEIVI